MKHKGPQGRKSKRISQWMRRHDTQWPEAHDTKKAGMSQAGYEIPTGCVEEYGPRKREGRLRQAWRRVQMEPGVPYDGDGGNQMEAGSTATAARAALKNRTHGGDMASTESRSDDFKMISGDS